VVGFEESTRIPSTSARRRGLRRLLVDAIQPRAVATLGDDRECTAAEVVAAADHHRVTPALYLHLKDADVPAAWHPALEARYEEQMRRHLTTGADLARLAPLLDRVDTRWAVMKGPVLSDRLWPRPDMRQYFDLDILVDRRQFGTTIETLVDNGARLVDCNWPLIHSQMRAELSLELPYGTSLDLHWDIVNDAALRRQLRPPVDAMLDRVVATPLGNLRAPAFDAVDTLLSLALHAALAGATRLVWLKDVERAAAQDGLDWYEVDRRARSAGLNLALTMTLNKAWRVLDGPIEHGGWQPHHGLWNVLAGVADRRYATPGVSGDAHTGQLLYRSVRRSSRLSAAAAWHGLTRPPAPSNGSQNPLHVPVGSPAARAAYFRAIEGPAPP
jgi:hypothetical protein